jgi:hypothetical protein
MIRGWVFFCQVCGKEVKPTASGVTPRHHALFLHDGTVRSCTGSSRQPLRRKADAPAAKREHGTEKGYRQHLRYHETACQDCLQAHRDFDQAIRDAAKATEAAKVRAPVAREHGTMRGVRQHLKTGEPLCEECREARNAYHREWRSRNDVSSGLSITRQKLRNKVLRRVLARMAELHPTEYRDIYAEEERRELQGHDQQG